MHEGDPRHDDAHAIHAFSIWLPVFEDCVRFEKEYFNHPKIDWARKKSGESKWRERWIGVTLGVLASLIATLIWESIQSHRKHEGPATAPHVIPAPILTTTDEEAR